MKQSILFLAVLGVFSLSGCGRVSSPALPEGSFYPHTYMVEETPLKAKNETLQGDETALVEELTLEEAQKEAEDYAKSIYD